MFFRQFYLECLAHASYLISSDGEAVIVDPQRDVDQYLSEAEAQGSKIRFILETHLHADFVSGHRELAERTGAEIVFGEKAAAEFPHRAVKEGDELMIGQVTFRAIETPGHTPEGISWLVTNHEAGAAEPQKLLTGDTLFIGDVGRPDLAGSRGYTSEQMASLLYDSLHERILGLDDSVEVWPAHGAGSSCGRNISKETRSTIGAQRRMNSALAPMPREEFVRMMTSDLPPAPRYFARDAEMNRHGAVRLSSLKAVSLSPQQVDAIASRSQIVDVRRSAAFAESHLPASINIGLRGQFAPWSGALLDPSLPIILVAETAADARESVMRLARVGLENVTGFLEGGVRAWHGAGLPLTSLTQITVFALHERIGEDGPIQIVDVRNLAEYESGHIPGASSSPLTLFPRRLPVLDRTVPVAVVCEGGYRSSAASSLLQRSGLSDVMNVIGGTSAWLAAGYEAAH